MEKGAVAQLILKKDAKPDTSKGLKIFYLNEKSGKPEYSGNTMIIWESDLKALASGVREVPVYIGKAYEKVASKKA